MKILIVSDTHGRHGNFDKVLEREGKIDMLIHLGDVEGDECYIRAVAECPVYMVAGNNDYFTDLPREAVIDICGQKVLITHGHYYYVSMGIEHLKREAMQRGVQAVFYGHTHRPLIDDEDILIANPGSLTYPRQSGRQCAYMVIETNGEGRLKPEIRYLV